MNKYGFSDEIPTLRLAWDATALSAYMRDPLSYYWQHVLGYRHVGAQLNLVWGSLWHEATAYYRSSRLNGMYNDLALLYTIQATLHSAQHQGLDELAGKNNKKNTYTLIRSLIWWTEEYKDRDYRTVALPDGAPALEYHFVVPLGFRACTGEDYLLCGSLDEIEEENGYQYVVERKTTTKTLSGYYFQNYDPAMQTYLYDLVGSFLLPKNPLRGIVVEACQTAVGFSRFMRHEITRTPAQREHWKRVIKYWIQRAEEDAMYGSWQYALNSECSAFGSAYKEIQTRTPAVWDGLLKADLKKVELWNPLEPK